MQDKRTSVVGNNLIILKNRQIQRKKLIIQSYQVLSMNGMNELMILTPVNCMIKLSVSFLGFRGVGDAGELNARR